MIPIWGTRSSCTSAAIKSPAIVFLVFISTLFSVVIGYVASNATQVVSFYFGSSKGSEQKSEAMATALTQSFGTPVKGPLPAPAATSRTGSIELREARMANPHPTPEFVHEHIDSIEKLFDSKIGTLRFEVVTGLSRLRELTRLNLENVVTYQTAVHDEVNRRLAEVEKSIERLDQANHDYVLREVY
ncbi:hypothetical protein [Burkholderia vietnamiensis]|uniref:hypothetical protein n=1 Tax=Burkholderia vietnamiensis TaxID=60552 RepID=UPI0011B5455E|nr:hypothetical protein [Burkholderia vietnamiensis]MBR7911382.1 hypothetical protein [Burkholderia vietnamiensis]MBR8150353.1 hypothetical protein [Burkholderia vietnamiensis]MCA7944521.1 hypothetical protein [Burkholderia vietnamiensis]MCA7986453.1 hypothetical protein [Burkholderia vietnamiensis]MCA8447032.1 hypothetical protein [Burkholderia vietnamiensis]